MKTSSKENLNNGVTLVEQINRLPNTGTVEDPVGNGKADAVPAMHFEFMLEAIRQRNETKTAILEQALQRSEWSQQRFWGINE